MFLNKRVNWRIAALLCLGVGLSISLSVFAQSGPSITAISPDSGNPGAIVTILGSGFGASAGSGTVTFNGVAATPNKWSSASITVAVPAGASTGPVLVTVGSATSNAVKFTVSEAQ
jgi:uncharacterized protein (TIGR03437 family)